MIEWTADGRPAAWTTETESEFDANERDSWQALAEFESAICPHCGNFKAICSTPDGVEGDGYHITQNVCYVTALEKATHRRLERMYGKTEPDGLGFKPTDGVAVRVALADDGSEDVLGLARDDLVPQQPPGEKHQPAE